MSHYQFKMNPNLLSSFLAVVDQKKIAAAAKVLNISQPSVTAQIAKLEAELGFPLFLRSIKGVELTEEGKDFLDYARKISELINKASSLGQREDIRQGRLKIFASTTIGNYLLPPILCDYAQRFGKIALELEVLPSEAVIERVMKEKQGLGLIEGPSRHAQLKSSFFIEDEIFLTVHPDWSGQIHGLQDLKKFPMILRERASGTRQIVERSLKYKFHKNDYPQVYELGSTEAIKLAIERKLGFAFLSRWSIQNELASKRLAILSKFSIRRDFSWVHSSGAISQLHEHFQEFAKSHPQIRLMEK